MAAIKVDALARLTSAPRPDTLWAVAHSFWITGAGVIAGFLVGAAAAGATTSPGALWAYTKVSWFGFVITQVVTPILRGAYTQAKAPQRPAS